MAICFNIVAILLLLAFYPALSSRSLELEQNILKDVFKDYDPSIRPSPVNNKTGPVLVRVDTYVRRINNIDDVKMEYDTQLTFRQSWYDDRLKYSARGMDYVTVTEIHKLWKPDVFFSNEKAGHFHNIIAPNTLLRIYPNGKVLYSIRLSLTLSCPMDLKNYPIDNQVCSIILASYGYTTDDVLLLWKEKDPVQLTKNLHLSKFSINAFFTDYCTSKTNTGEYSCLKIDFLFSRDLFYYFETAYLPTMALVLLSWLSFWLKPKLTNIRLGIWIGVLVAMTIVTASINDSTPSVSYTKAIDVWLRVCFCFVFCVVIELSWVSNCVMNEENSQNNYTAEDKHSMGIDDGKRKRLINFARLPLRWFNKYDTKSERIDVASRILFPAIFGLFNLIYWTTYTSNSIE